jgi:uroporphyrinogen III methyltransferase/synthase
MLKNSGFCYLVGAGPGDPGLLTLRGKECLATAQVVIYDALCSPEFLRFAPESAELIFAGKRAGKHTLSQTEMNRLLVKKAQSGLRIVRLKGGDPFLFGRGGEEAEALAEAGVPFEIVPGVTSITAGPAYAGIPVTHRSHNACFTVFTGHEDPEKNASKLDYEAIARASGTKVMLMGVERIDAIAQALIANGMARETPVALIRWATTGRQRTLEGTLSTIAQQVRETQFSAPAIAVFGEVVTLRKKLNWFESRPLFGKRIAVTRSRQQAGVLLQALRNLGADAFELPTIRIEPPRDIQAFRELVSEAHCYDWLVFTSPNGVDAFFRVFFEIYQDAREIGGVRIAAIGPTTADRIRSYRFQVDLIPEKYVAESLLEAFQKEGDVENLHVLLAHTEGSRKFLFEELTQLGAIVDEAIAYRTVPEVEDVSGGVQRFHQEGADLITFTSSSTVENFAALQLPLPKNLKTASIGPITSQTLKQLGFHINIEATEHTIPGLVEAIRLNL